MTISGISCEDTVREGGVRFSCECYEGMVGDGFAEAREGGGTNVRD